MSASNLTGSNRDAKTWSNGASIPLNNQKIMKGFWRKTSAERGGLNSCTVHNTIYR
jgi:hypothetical protein